MHCSSCEADDEPSYNMNAACKVVACCPRCGAEYPGAERVDATATAKPIVASGAMPSLIRHLSPTVAAHSEPVDVISQIATRRAWLATEIARLKGLEAEASALDRMMRSAKPRKRRKSGRAQVHTILKGYAGEKSGPVALKATR